MNKRVSATLIMATVVAASPIGLATSAQAALQGSGCSISVDGPSYAGRNSSNEVLLAYPIDITCLKGRTIEVYQEQWEEDGGSNDDYIANSYTDLSFETEGGSKHVVVSGKLPHTEARNEEMYQKVRFRVTEGHTTSSWTPYERSGASWIWH